MCMEELGARLRRRVTLCDYNAEADRLSNGDTTGFSDHLRLDADMNNMRWRVLDELPEAGAAFQSDNEDAQARGFVRQPARKRRREERLRVREPWQ